MTARGLGCATVLAFLIVAFLFMLGAFVPWLTDKLLIWF